MKFKIQLNIFIDSVLYIVGCDIARWPASRLGSQDSLVQADSLIVGSPPVRGLSARTSDKRGISSAPSPEA